MGALGEGIREAAAPKIPSDLSPNFGQQGREVLTNCAAVPKQHSALMGVKTYHIA